MLRTAFNVIRTGVGYFLGGIWTIICGTSAIIMAAINAKSPMVTRIMRAWGWVITKLAGVKVTVEGVEHVDPDASYVIVSNHLSNVDPPIHIAYLPTSVRFLAKKELFKVPIFGHAMRAIGIVETDRTGNAAAHRTINEGVARVIELGVSLIIYPEGHRSRDGSLHPFKKGAFRIAVDNDMDILPASITGTWDAWPPGSKTLRGGKARITLHPPIPTNDLGPADLNDLRDQVSDIIQGTMDRDAAAQD